MGRIATTCVLSALCVHAALVFADEPAAAWSVKKLPGCENLPARMAGYYQPVAVTVRPAAPQYKLPLDLAKLTNADFKTKVYQFRNKALAAKAEPLLKRNAFVVFGGRGHEDVAKFYKYLKTAGLPIFITSDSLLHLYHIQFDETLKDIEEREFHGDALLISKAIQGQANRLYGSATGDVKAAAELLMGFAAVPAKLLSKLDFGADAAGALKEVNSWPARLNWRQRQQFMEKYEELLKELQGSGAKRAPGPRPAPGPMLRMGPPGGRSLAFGDPKVLKQRLAAYVKAHPARSPGPDKTLPAAVDKAVRAELGLIAAHRGFAESPLFKYKEDYSQYVPRGHYTRSKKLKQYFKALMWYGRMTFLIRGRSPDDPGALISLAEARKQTLAASILAGMMESEVAPARTLAAAWDRLYAVTAYYVGLADDLTPYEYRHALRSAIGRAVSASALTDAKNFFELRKALASLRKPAIYSGTGDIEGPPAAIADERTLAKALAATQGMRLMGQRYIPDSFMMGRVVYPTVGPFNGKGSPFTLVLSRGGPIRGFPRGLDVMAVLGSDRARHWLKRLGDDQYARYDEKLAELQKQFGQVDELGWNRNMYWSWLHTLRALLKDYPSGYPSFMQTPAWRDKQLSAALASWAQLRHDTILYAKQSYTMSATGLPPRPKMVEGYVEPVPEFYGRLLALTRMTLKGLDDFKVLDGKARRRLASLESVVARLLELSRQELANRKLTAKDYEFIRSFGARLKSVVAGVNEQGLETTIVADVHTDGNTRTVLEEGTGHLHPMVVVYPMPDGGLVAGVGPVLSHYEFKQPMANRLTDEAWKRMLRGGKAPDLPEWARTFTVAPLPRPAGPTRRPGRPGPVRPAPLR